ncbi:MAG: hypothetical protein AB1779_04850 [Candidatus Thermoplasmatota archaeon]
MAEGIKLIEEKVTRNATGTFSHSVTAKINKAIDYITIDIDITLAETGGTNPINDTGALNAIERIEVKIGGNLLYEIRGIEEVDYATGHGMIGELNRLLFGSSVYQEGDAAVAAGGSEIRNVNFKLPLFTDQAGKDLNITIYFRAVADWTSGAGVARVNDETVIVYVHYVEGLPSMKFQTHLKTGIGPSKEYTIPLDDDPDYFIIGIIGTAVRSGAYEDDIEKMKLEDTGGKAYQEFKRTQAVKHIVDKGKLIAQYAATKTFAEKNEGTFPLPIEPVQCKSQRVKIFSGPSASATDIRLFVLLSSTMVRAEEIIAQKPVRGEVSPEGYTSTTEPVEKPAVTPIAALPREALTAREAVREVVRPTPRAALRT